MLKQVKHWLRGNGERTTSSSDLMARLGIMIFRCDSGQRYRRISPIADWVYSFVEPDAVISDARGLPFNFLGAFLDECDELIKSERSLNDEAELWHELDKNGALRSLSVRLFMLDSKHHLLIQNLDETFANKQEMYQRAREQTLTLEALAKAEADLRESNKKLELIMRQAPAVFWCADVDGIMTYCSGSALESFGCRNSRCVGKSILELFKDVNTPTDVILSAHDIAVAGEASTFETRSGKRFFDVRVEPLYDDIDKGIIGSSGVCVESTERVAAEANAVAALQAKTDFVAGISHEIRTPMNAIIGLNELALDLPVTKEQEVYLQSAISAGESLLSIIDQLLDFSKIEKGRNDLENILFKPRDLVYDVLSELAVHAHGKGLELISMIDDDVADAFRGDSGRLKQILVNLVGNAVKFTATGEVQVKVNVEKSNLTHPHVMLHFSVCDTGIGVLPEKQELIFDAFRQAEAGTIRKYGGTGLGLSIASQLTRMLGGQIWIVSPGKDGISSEFHFTVVLSEVAVKEIECGDKVEMPEEKLPSSCMLVGLQGNALLSTNCILTKIFGQVAQVTVPEDVSSQIVVPAADASGVLVVELPADSKARVRMLKYLHGVRESKSTIIAISAVGIPPSEMESLRSFCNSVLLKPVNAGELRSALLNTHKQDEDLEIIQANLRERLRVIVVDDNELNQWVTASIFRNRGHEVTIVSSGLEAVKLARQRSFDVLLLDIKIPDIDGYEVTRRIRGDEQRSARHRHLPIIALTGHIRSGTRERCAAAGMDGYLLKPVRLKALFRMIEKVLKANKVSDSNSDSGRSNTLDPDALEKLTGGNNEVKSSMLVAAGRMFDETLNKVEDSLNEMDFESVEKNVGRIINVGEEIGAKDLTAVAKSLKNMASIQDVDGGRARLIELRSEKDRLSRLSV